MTYDRATGTVIYRSKMHLGLKRNFQVMPGAQWLALLCKHIPDRYDRRKSLWDDQGKSLWDEHLVRYVGWYSNRARGERAKALNSLKEQDPGIQAAASLDAASEFASRAKAPGWGRGPTLPCGHGASARSTKLIRSGAQSVTAPCA